MVLRRGWGQGCRSQPLRSLGAGSPSPGVPDVPASWWKVAASATRLKVACQGRGPMGSLRTAGSTRVRKRAACLFILGAVAKSGVFASRELPECRVCLLSRVQARTRQETSAGSERRELVLGATLKGPSPGCCWFESAPFRATGSGAPFLPVSGDPPPKQGRIANPPSSTRRRQWQPTPVLLPGKSHGQRSLVGCRLWGHTESDTTEVT